LIEFNKEVLVTGDEENLVVNEARMAEIYAEIDIIRAWMIT
jgi:hypothetical protein